MIILLFASFVLALALAVEISRPGTEKALNELLLYLNSNQSEDWDYSILVDYNNLLYLRGDYLDTTEVRAYLYVRYEEGCYTGKLCRCKGLGYKWEEIYVKGHNVEELVNISIYSAIETFKSLPVLNEADEELLYVE